MSSIDTKSIGAKVAPTAISSLPPVGQSPTRFGSFVFETGAEPPDRPGVFMLTESVAGRVKPLFVGEAESIVNAIGRLRTVDARFARDCKGGALWMTSPFPTVRSATVAKLITDYHPPLNEAPLDA